MAGPSAQREMIPADEVQAIIDARVKQAIDDQLGSLKELVSKAAPNADAAETSGLMQSLAMAIANLTDQGTGRKRVAPEELQKRERGRMEMFRLIDEAAANGENPHYKLRHLVYLGEQKVNPVWIDSAHRQQPTEIVWPGPPNQAMVPVNDTAKRIHAAFLQWIGEEPVADLGPMRVTASGLAIVKGPPGLASDAAEAQHTGGGRSGPLVPQIVGRGAPGPTIETHILGTVMPPARQNP